MQIYDEEQQFQTDPMEFNFGQFSKHSEAIVEDNFNLESSHTFQGYLIEESELIFPIEDQPQEQEVKVAKFIKKPKRVKRKAAHVSNSKNKTNTRLNNQQQMMSNLKECQKLQNMISQLELILQHTKAQLLRMLN